MIKKIHITNFKGIKDTVTVELKPITLLFGPNSAGKSTIIHAIHYAKEILERKNLDPRQTKTGGSAIHLGGFKNLIYNHDLSRTISLQFDFDLSDVDLPGAQDVDSEDVDNKRISEISGEAKSGWIKFDIKWLETLDRPEVVLYEIGMNNELTARMELDYDNPKNVRPYLSYHSLKSLISEAETELFEKTSKEESEGIRVYTDWSTSALPPIEADLSEMKSIKWGEKETELASTDSEYERSEAFKEVYEMYTKLLFMFGKMLLIELDRFRYIGPLRELPQRNFEPHYLDEEERWANGLAAWDALFNESVSVKLVNEWLDKLNTGYKVSYREYFENPTNVKTEELNELLEDGIDGLSDYLTKSRADSDKGNRQFELFYFKKMLELQESINSGQLNKISSIANKINEEFKNQITALTDHQSSLWGDFNDELGAVKKDIKEDIHVLLNKGRKNSEMFRRLCLINTDSQIMLDPYDIGVGVSQVLPVVVAALTTDNNILSIEQPELHIHPAMQVELADLFISEIKKRDRIFLLETHSEHIMLRLLRRIEETTSGKNKDKNLELDANQLSVIWFEADDTALKLTSLPIDETGEFTRKWPKGFFEERAEELFPDD